MALTDKSHNIYAKCNHIARTQPKYEVSEQLYKEIATDYRLLPTFEKTLYEKVYTKHFSLQRNEHLKCCWAQYKKNIEGRVFAPFQFPSVSALHFYNCAVRFMPEASIKMMDHRKKMVPGPGVDSRGHRPIPQEAMMKRGTPKKANVKTFKKTPKN